MIEGGMRMILFNRRIRRTIESRLLTRLKDFHRRAVGNEFFRSRIYRYITVVVVAQRRFLTVR